MEKKRSGYNLHPGSVSWGCVTICSQDPQTSPELREKEWQIINKAINATQTEKVPDRRGKQKYVPFTKQTKFGTLKVKDSPKPSKPSAVPKKTGPIVGG